MVNNTLISLSKLFRALGDPTRLSVLEKLSTDGEASATELCKPFVLTLPAMLKHLRVLEDAGLISQKKQGKERRAILVSEVFKNAVEWIATLNGNWAKNPNNRRNEWEEFRKTKSNAIRERLVKKYLYLVKYVAGRIAISLPPNVEFNDLVSYGILGLFEAINHYDLVRDNKFETYAASHIRNTIIKEIKKCDWAPKLTRKRTSEIDAKCKSLEERSGKVVPNKAVARSLGLEVDKLNSIYGELGNEDLSALHKGRFSFNNAQDVPRRQVFEDSLLAERFKRLGPDEVQKLFTAAVEDLSEKEKLVIYLYYYENLTLKEIGEILDVSESRVCQIHAQVVASMRKSLKKSSDDQLLVNND